MSTTHVQAPAEGLCTVVVAADGSTCGKPSEVTWTSSRGATYYECEEHNWTTILHHEPKLCISPAVGHHVEKRPLTRHQREVYNRLSIRSWHRRPDRWVALEQVGSKQGLLHLVAKGWVEQKIEYGPRGGERLFFRPL